MIPRSSEVRPLWQGVIVSKLIEDIASAVLGLAAVTLLLTAEAATTSLLGIGILLGVAIGRLRTIANQQSQQTELLALIAEGQDVS